MPTSPATPIDIGEDVEATSDEHEPLADRLEAVGQQVGTFIRDRPIAAVGIALGVGFLLGRLFR